MEATEPQKDKMGCRKKNIRELIVDFIDENLEPQAAQKVSEHLNECPDCRRLEQEYRQTITGLRAAMAEEAAEHIPNDSLIQYTDNPESLDENTISHIQLHLAVCSQCERKVEMLRQVGAEEVAVQSEKSRDWSSGLSRNVTRIFGHKPVFGFSMAAVIILAFAVIYWSVIGPDQGLQLRFASTRNVEWLSESIRSNQPLPEIHEKDGQIMVGLKFLAFFDEETYSVQLQTTEGTVLQELKIDEPDYDKNGVGLAIETANLSPGEYRLALISRRLSDESSGPQVTYPFILIRDKK